MPFPRSYFSGFPSQIVSCPEQPLNQHANPLAESIVGSSWSSVIHTFNKALPIIIHLTRRTDITFIGDEQFWNPRSENFMRDRGAKCDSPCCWWGFRWTVESYYQAQPEANQKNRKVTQDGRDASAFPRDWEFIDIRNFFVFWSRGRWENHGWGLGFPWFLVGRSRRKRGEKSSCIFWVFIFLLSPVARHRVRRG